MHKVMVAALCMISLTVQANDLLLTGRIGSSAKQLVNSPQGSRWQIQIQWMEEEGKVVQKGDPIIVFDGATEQNQLLTAQENLDRLELEYKQLELEQEQKVIDADGALRVAKMRVDKARIEASVPDGEVSAYDKGQYELELQRALLEQVKSEEALARAKQEREAEMTKKRVDIMQTKDQIEYLENIMLKLRVEAQFSGPVSYAIHPWTGEKVAAGMNVRPGWTIMDVQSTNQFQIETWIHEIDAVGLVEGTKVLITLDAFPNKSFSGTLSEISKQSESRPNWSKSAYFPAIITFDSDISLDLLPGMSVRLLLTEQAIAEAKNTKGGNNV